MCAGRQGVPAQVTAPSAKYVGRAGRKLESALAAFGLDVTGLCCADFGCNVGGFTDCLLQHGAARVYAVDTGYGTLAWKLRTSERVVVMERTNALHCDVPEPVDRVTVDTAWTVQHVIVPAALRWLRPGGRIVSLLKPHYELAKLAGRKPVGKLPDAECRRVCLDVCRRLEAIPCRVHAVLPSAVRGKGGNLEILLLLSRP